MKGVDVTVFDDRPALTNHRYFPAAVRLRVDGVLREVTPPPKATKKKAAKKA